MCELRRLLARHPGHHKCMVWWGCPRARSECTLACLQARRKRVQTSSPHASPASPASSSPACQPLSHDFVRCGGCVPCLPFTPSRKAREAWVVSTTLSSYSASSASRSPSSQSIKLPALPPVHPSVREVKKGLNESTENQSWLGAIVRAREGEARVLVGCGVGRAREAL